MSNSPLVDYTILSPNCTKPRNHEIDTITIHCVVGQCDVRVLGNMFANPKRQGSSNYGIGKDGKIGLFVEEKNRSWCSGGKDKNGNPIRVNGMSGGDNDHRAITIEVASDTTHPYAVTKAAYNSLINLLVDICKRNSIKELKWKGDKNLVGRVDQQNMTVHRWFANKACPGDYLYNRHGQIAKEVNARLGTATPAITAPCTVKVSISNLNIRKGPGTNYATTGRYTGKGIFTITEESAGPGSDTGWGKLKSGAGWISLDYVKKIKGV